MLPSINADAAAACGDKDMQKYPSSLAVLAENVIKLVEIPLS